MLAPSALRRLAATALPRSFLAPARASVAAHLFLRRSYATSSSDTEPTETVKKAVKAKARAATKAATTKKTTTTKKAAPTKAKKAKKAAPKKAAPKKPKRSSKPLTAEEQAKKTFSTLRKVALLSSQPMTAGKLSARTSFIGNFLKGKTDVVSQISNANQAFRQLTPAELEHWNHVAAALRETREANYRAWVESFSPDQIRVANIARGRMRAMLRDSAYKLSRCRHLTHIYDERHVLRPRLAWCQFLQDRITHSDFDGIALGQRTKLISAEYNALSEDEKKVYKDRAIADQARYRSEMAEYDAKSDSGSSI